jgi:hypothetical protein
MWVPPRWWETGAVWGHPVVSDQDVRAQLVDYSERYVATVTIER